MAATKDLKQQLEQETILATLRAVRRGDFSVRLPMSLTGIEGEIAVEFNDIMELILDLGNEMSRVVREIGHKGKRQKIAADQHRGSKMADCFVLLWDSERNLPVIAALDGSPWI